VNQEHGAVERPLLKFPSNEEEEMAIKDVRAGQPAERMVLGLLARTAGCPNGVPVIPWLLANEFLRRKNGGSYQYTSKARTYARKIVRPWEE
jgi:hypothetical protein